MPYANEHSCRLENPDKYDSFNRKNCGQKHDGKCIDVVYGIKDGKSEIQALRYGTDIWSESDARAHCKEREGTFEPAEKESKAMKKEIERRTFDLDDIEIRSEDDQPKIRGHAAVFNKLSEDLGGFREIIMPGAFTEAIQKDDIRALFNHDPNYVLGRNKSSTLALEEDDKGLAIEIDPPDTQWARDLMVSIKRGDISQMSFAFNIRGKKGEEWDTEEGKTPVRRVISTKLYDISPVTYPAYPQTDVKVRSILAEAGIDYDALVAALESAERGSPSEEEAAVLSATIEKIRSYLPAGAEAEGEPGSQELTGDSAHLDMLRKRLALIAKT
ncbi:MAG TPA: HK97 family phage prohead protease [Dehalococcoidales bacterium]|nr:HK97 family phage prohead protease [Dehalococcoidales bacterium]